MLRPDLREPLGLAALDANPPEPCPHPRLTWARDLGVWLDGDVVISTVATSARRNLYYAACRARRTLEAAARAAGQSPPRPREIFELAEAMVLAAEEEKAWRAAGRTRHAPDDLDVGATFAAEREGLPEPDADGALLDALAWASALLGEDADAAEVQRIAELSLEARLDFHSPQSNETEPQVLAGGDDADPR